MLKKLLLASVFTIASFSAAKADGVVVQGELSPGVYANIPVDNNHYLMVDCPGCTGAAAPTGANNSDAVAVSSTGLTPTETFNYGFNGITWDRLQVDGTKNLKVNCVTGCSASSGTGSNNADAVVVVTTGLTGTETFPYGFNGTTWDRLQVDASKFLKVNVSASLPAGTNVVGGVTQSGTWTVQPGNTANTTPWLATINQGGNSASVTVANALKVDNSAVTQPISGAVSQSGTWTVATNADGTVAAGAAPSKGLLTDCQFNTSLPTLTTTQVAALQCTSNAELKVNVDNAISLTGALPAGTNLLGAVRVRPDTANGLTPSKVISAASTNSTLISTGAHNVYLAATGNTGAGVAFLKVYDKSTAPTCGTDTPKLTFIIPGNAAGAGSNIPLGGDIGFSVTSGLGICITGVVTDADTTAVAANQVVVDLLYN